MRYLDKNLTVMQNKHNTREEEKSTLRNDKAAPSIHFTVNRPRISLFGLYDVLLLLCAFCTIILVIMLREMALNILQLNTLR